MAGIHGKGKEGVLLDLGDGGVLLATAQEGASVVKGYFHSGETLAGMLGWLGRALKDHVVISWPHTSVV